MTNNLAKFTCQSSPEIVSQHLKLKAVTDITGAFEAFWIKIVNHLKKIYNKYYPFIRILLNNTLFKSLLTRADM